MSKNRAIRRAAERLARNAAMQQQAQAQQPLVMTAAAAAGAYFGEEEIVDTPRPISDAKLAANRANAQKSTGPVTPEGRNKSSLNAVKTALTGQTVLLPTDDVEAYQAHVQQHIDYYAPATPQERSLVQRIADANWRIDRIAPLEAGVLAIGRKKLADLYPEETDPVTRETLIKSEIYLVYRRDLNNLALQERRLRNQKKADIAELQALRAERKKAAPNKVAIQNQMLTAIRLLSGSQNLKIPFDPARLGFEFSTAEIEYCCDIMSEVANQKQPLPWAVDLLAEFRDGQMEASAA